MQVADNFGNEGNAQGLPAISRFPYDLLESLDITSFSLNSLVEGVIGFFATMGIRF